MIMEVRCATGSDKKRLQKSEAEKLFLDKMTILNRNFLHFIQCSLKEMPDADLSPSVRDYLKHVENLDRTYGGNGYPTNSALVTSTNVGVEKKMVVEESVSNEAHLSESNVDIEDQIKKKSSPVHAKSSLNRIFVSNSSAAPSVVSDLYFDSSDSSFASRQSDKRGRKRAKRGGPEGGDEEVIISNHNTPTSSRHSTTIEEHTNKAVAVQVANPSQMPSFSNISATDNFLETDFNNSENSGKGTNDEKDIVNVEKVNNRSSLFSFDRNSDSMKNEIVPNSPEIICDKSSSVGLKEMDKADREKEQISNSANKQPIKNSLLIPAITGNITSPVEHQTSTPVEEKEYIPPKPEAVITEEPNSIFSTKCSVFVLRGNEYEKLGIGQLHIKKDGGDSGKKILLIRAATTTGAVWVNAYIDNTMKLAKIDEVKLRMSCVSGGSPSTYLIRLPKAEDCDKTEKEILK